MKILKIALISVFVVAIAIAGIVGITLYNLDSLVETAIEEVGPQVTQTPVTVDKVNLSLLSGLGEINGLTLGNPEGFTSDYAFHMAHIALQIEPQSLLEPVYVVKQVTIDGAKIIAEQKAMTTNLQALLKNIEKSTSSGSAPTKQETDKSTDSNTETSEPHLMVEQISIINNSVTLITERWGKKELKIPDIQLSNIGSKDEGLTAEQLANVLLKKITREAEKTATKELEKMAKEKAKKKLSEKLKDKLNSLFGN